MTTILGNETSTRSRTPLSPQGLPAGPFSRVMTFSRNLRKPLSTMLAMVLVLFACLATPIPAQAYSLEGKVEVTRNKYRIGPGDVMSVQVYHQPDLAQADILVRADGYASFNGIGELPVGGRNIEEITRMLEAEIGELVLNPRVTVTVTKLKPGTIYLAGAVMKPGMFQFTADRSNTQGQAQSVVSRLDLRVSNILANAGGVLPNADLSRVQVTRSATGEVQTINLWKLLREGSSQEDLTLESGDSIFIPAGATMALNDEDFKTLVRSSIGPGGFPVRVIGQVGKPGVYELNGTSPYLNSAIGQAGGFVPGANRKVIAIRRFSSEHDVSTIFVDPNKTDITLRPNDIVFVSEQKVYVAGRYFEVVNKILAPFTSLSSAAITYSAFRGGIGR